MKSGIKLLLFISSPLWILGCGTPLIEVNGVFMTKDQALKHGYIPSPEQEQERRELAKARLKPEDVIFVTVRVDPSLTHSYKVTKDGDIDLEYAGRIAVIGLTEREAADRIKKHLETLVFIEADVNVELEGTHGEDQMSTGGQGTSITNMALSVQYQLSPTVVSELATALLGQIAGTSLVVSASALPPRSMGALPKRDYETFRIIPPGIMCDGFVHTIYIDRKTTEFWILRTGGFAGTHELFGPGHIELRQK